MIRSVYSLDFGRRLAYLLLGLPASVLWTAVFPAAFGLAFGLAFVLIGIPLFALVLIGVRMAGDAERWLLLETVGERVEPAPRAESSGSSWRRLLEELRDPRNWRALAFVVLRSLTGPFVFAAALIVVVYPLWALSSAAWGWWVFGLQTVSIIVSGVLALLLGPWIAWAFTESHLSVARALLGPSTMQLTERADVVQQTRDRSIEAAAAERRRIERDLHDGAQARLSTVALDLGRAKRRIDQGGDPDEVRAIIDTAHEDAKAAIVELRDLARGIHPPVLTDRGLVGALDEIVARSPIPVHLDVRVDVRPPAHVESAAYFAVSELLTNATRHSRAATVWVTVRANDRELVIDVSDDGVGGADPAIGSGLRGLEDRVAALDGTMTVTSLLGEGTSVLIEVPR